MNNKDNIYDYANRRRSGWGNVDAKAIVHRKPLYINALNCW